MKSPVPARFDYSDLTADAREMAERTAEKIRRHQQRTSREIIDIGTDLMKVKEALGHGRFTAWLQAKFGWSDKTARNYMNAARVFGGAKAEIISVLPPTTLYLLSARSTPETITGKIVDELKSGRQPNPAAIKAEVEAFHRGAKDQARREQEQKPRAKRLKKLKDPERAERRWAKEQEQQKELQKQAAATAQKIIDEVGVELVARVLDATHDDWLVERALRDAVQAARDRTRQSAA